MQTHWLKRAGGKRLAVFALGWAADWRVIRGEIPEDCDVLAVFNYRFIDTPLIPCYSESYLFAWSFGVLASEHIFRGQKFTKSIALNGTPKPVDEHYGIAPRRMAATLKGLEKGGMEAFERRAYGEFYKPFTGRCLSDNILELNNLCALSEQSLELSIEWDKAIVGTRDEIFTPENQLSYWGSRAESLPLPHYPFGDEGLIMREIGDR